MTDLSSLKITEVFYSLQGETKTVGLPTVFIRLTGCPLRCLYCDSAYAFTGGKRRLITDIMSEVDSYTPKYITVTGGEPLSQPACLPLLKQLCDKGYQVSLETSGALSVANVDQRVVKVVDIKTPDSNEVEKNKFDNIQYMTKNDQFKFVICSEQDYRWAIKILKDYDLSSICEVLFSPSYDELSSVQLAEWILRDRLPVRFQLQLHKVLWGDIPGK